MNNKTIWILALVLFVFSVGKAEGPGRKKQATIAFYNVENLFDCEDDPNKDDAQFLPNGDYQWTEEHLKIKLGNIAKVISQLGDDDGPEILGLCEVENLNVLKKLAGHPLLKKHGYEAILNEGPDERGIDVALLYKKKKFMPLYTKNFEVSFDFDPEEKTRSILMVKGILDDEHDITLFVNHWPSRRGGAEESAPKRETAAKVLRAAVDSIQALDKYANIFIMGDFNDEPLDNSVLRVLNAGKDTLQSAETFLFNAFAKIQEEGQGTLMYKQEWDLFDQIIVSQEMIEKKALLKYVKCSASIYHPEWMQVEAGDWKDAPKRTHISKKFMEDGYSDHFPVYIQVEY